MFWPVGAKVINHFVVVPLHILGGHPKEFLEGGIAPIVTPVLVVYFPDGGNVGPVDLFSTYARKVSRYIHPPYEWAFCGAGVVGIDHIAVGDIKVGSDRGHGFEYFIT